MPLQNSPSAPQTLLSALAWQYQQGVRLPCQETPSNWYQRNISPIHLPTSQKEHAPANQPAPIPHVTTQVAALMPALPVPAPTHMTGSLEAIETARKIANSHDDLQSLITAIKDFEAHPLKIMANHTLIYQGNAEADIMFIGDVPSKQDDLQGKLFTDDVGILMENMLGSIKLTQEDYLLSNIIYWRPPGDRSLTDSEITICRAFFEKIIALCNPKIIVALGHVAGTALLAHQEREEDSTRKTVAYGDIQPYQNQFMQTQIPLLVTLHPKYLLHAPQKKQQAWHNLLALEKIITQNKASSINR